MDRTTIINKVVKSFREVLDQEPRDFLENCSNIKPLTIFPPPGSYLRISERWDRYIAKKVIVYHIYCPKKDFEIKDNEGRNGVYIRFSKYVGDEYNMTISLTSISEINEELCIPIPEPNEYGEYVLIEPGMKTKSAI